MRKPLHLLCSVIILFLLLFAYQAYALKQFETLVQRLKSSPNFKVRIQAALLLGKSGEERALEPLIAALNDEHYTVRGAAAIGIGQIGNVTSVETLLTSLTDEEKYVRDEIRRVLTTLAHDEKSLPYLISTMKHPNPVIRLESLKLLKSLQNDSGIEVLIESLSDEDRGVKAFAIESIRALGWEKAGNYLMAALDNKDYKIRKEAIKRLGKMKERRSITKLASILELRSDTPEIQNLTRNVLTELKSFYPLDSLKTVFNNSADKHRRAQSIILAGILKDEESKKFLIESLKDHDPYIRGTTALTLADIKVVEATNEINNMIKDKSNTRILPVLRNSLKKLQK